MLYFEQVIPGESSSLCFTVPTTPWWKYFSLINFCQRPSPFSSFHHHLQRRLIFIFWMFLMPRPPCFLLLLMISHLRNYCCKWTLLPYWICNSEGIARSLPYWRFLDWADLTLKNQIRTKVHLKWREKVEVAAASSTRTEKRPLAVGDFPSFRRLLAAGASSARGSDQSGYRWRRRSSVEASHCRVQRRLFRIQEGEARGAPWGAPMYLLKDR